MSGDSGGGSDGGLGGLGGCDGGDDGPHHHQQNCMIMLGEVMLRRKKLQGEKFLNFELEFQIRFQKVQTKNLSKLERFVIGSRISLLFWGALYTRVCPLVCPSVRPSVRNTLESLL